MNITHESDNKFSSTDLALIATLSITFPIDTINKLNPQKAIFIFKRTDELDRMVDAYWRQELRVEPQAYFGQLKIIKTRIYEEK